MIIDERARRDRNLINRFFDCLERERDGKPGEKLCRMKIGEDQWCLLPAEFCGHKPKE
jgi:hypothetical protein